MSSSSGTSPWMYVFIILSTLCLVLLILFWPFFLVRQYFLLTQGIDGWEPTVVMWAVLAQVAYYAAFFLVVNRCRSVRGAKKGVRERLPWILDFLGFCGVLMAAMVPPYFDSPQERIDSFKEFCEEEQRAAGMDPTSMEILDCVQRKLDAMWP